MGCFRVRIAAAASARPSARKSRVQVWFGLHLRLSWKLHASVGRLNYRRKQFVLHCYYNLCRHPTAGCLTRHYHRTSYDCILGSSPSLIESDGVSFVG